MAHPPPEPRLLAVCGTMADCDDYRAVAAWGATHLSFPSRYQRYDDGVPGGRWLRLLMSRIDPALFSAVFTAWARETWPDRPGLVAIDGKTSRRGRDRAKDKGPPHLVSAFATASRLAPLAEVEEERRRLYVAMTRQRRCALDDSATALSAGSEYAGQASSFHSANASSLTSYCRCSITLRGHPPHPKN